MMKYFFYILAISTIFSSSSSAVTADELMQIHKVTTTEMNNINTPIPGSLVYNTSENSLYFYTGTLWKKMRSSGSETIVNAGTNINISGNGTTSAPYVIGL